MVKHKGFRTGGRAPRTATITFAEGHALHGIEVKADLRMTVDAALGAEGASIRQAIVPFVERIISWNLEDDAGEPVPVSVEAFGKHFDITEARALLMAWLEAATSAPAPLERPLNGASTSRGNG